MEIGSLLVTLAIAIIVVGYVARPLIDDRGIAVSDSDRRLSSLQAQRDQILNVLQELEMDHTMGKISPEDYREQRSSLVAQGARVLRELDLVSGVALELDGEMRHPDLISEKLEEQIEAAVLKRRAVKSEIEYNYCSKCGSALELGDRFCPRCGAATGPGEVQ
jgi:rubrerythrin